DRKKGYFGKAELATNGKEYWNNNAMINAFKGKRKLSAFGIMSSTGKIGLDWRESEKYGASNTEMTYDDGNYYIMSNNDDDFGGGNYYGEGLPKGWNAGAMYANKFNDDKISVNGSYTYRKLNSASEGSIQSKYILPDTTYFINEKGNRFNSKYRNSFNGIYEYQLDSSSSIKVTGKGFFGNTISLNNSDAESLDEFGRSVNASQRHIYSKTDNTSINSSAIYRKKFKKLGRTISFNFTQNYTANKSAGSLMANYDFFDENGAVKRSDTTNQQKLRDNSSSAINTRFVYTEPLSKRSILEFNYGLSNTKGESKVSTFEKMSSVSDKYDKPVDSLSSNYSLNVLNNSAGINYRYAYPKKLNFSFGGNIARADFSRKDIKGDSSLNYSFLNFFPRASLNVPAPGGGNIRFDYSGYTRAPSVDQLQPIRDNSDELNQYVGNPDLKQSFNQRYNLGYNTFKMLSERYISTQLSFNTVNNDFSVNNFVDSLGKRLTQPVNVNGNRSVDFSIYYGKKISDKGIYLNGQANVNNSRITNFINTIRNVNQNLSTGLNAGLSYRKEKKWDILIDNSIAYNRTFSSIRPEGVTSFITHDHRIDLTFYLPAKLEIGTETNFSFRQKTDAFDRNNNFIKWDARLERTFLKKDNCIIRLEAFDLLNQNIGIQRDIKSNFISEKRYNSFKRYFLLSILYNFTNNGTK
ncbi:MAG: outer membrane beta-barrel protein, partial [Flavitalea sp.]